MRAISLLSALRERGVVVSVYQGNRFRVQSTAPISEVDRGLIHTHREDLIKHFHEEQDGQRSAGVDPPSQLTSNQTCSNCAHRTPAKSCGAPVEAGLAEHFKVVWLDMIGKHEETCTAYQPADGRD